MAHCIGSTASFCWQFTVLHWHQMWIESQHLYYILPIHNALIDWTLARPWMHNEDNSQYGLHYVYVSLVFIALGSNVQSLRQQQLQQQQHLLAASSSSSLFHSINDPVTHSHCDTKTMTEPCQITIISLPFQTVIHIHHHIRIHLFIN